MLSIERIRLIVDVVKMSSFSKVAKSNKISVSAVVQSIDVIEDRCGFKIFDRKSGIKPSLTERGKQVYLYCLEAEPKLNKLENYLSTDKNDTGDFKIYICPYLNNNIYLDVISETVKKYEHVRFSIINNNLDDADLYIGLGGMKIAYDGSEEVIGSAYWRLAVSKEHPLGKKHQNHFMEDISFYKQIILDTNNRFSDEVLASLCYSSDFIDCSDIQTLVSLLKKRLGFAILPDLLVKEIQKGNDDILSLSLEGENKTLFWPIVAKNKMEESKISREIINNLL